jgi:hypothetical protein
MNNRELAYRALKLVNPLHLLRLRDTRALRVLPRPLVVFLHNTRWASVPSAVVRCVAALGHVVVHREAHPSTH